VKTNVGIVFEVSETNEFELLAMSEGQCWDCFGGLENQ
jgi:hypothetical protein